MSIETELRDTAKTLSQSLRRKAPPLISVLLGELFDALPGVPRSSVLQLAATRTATALQDADARAAFFSLGMHLWNRLSSAKALSRERADVLAERLAPCARFPALLFFLEQDAFARGFDDASRRFAAELDEAFPTFRTRRATARFEWPLLEALGATHRSLSLKLDADGCLKKLSVKSGLSLTIVAPGEGTFSHEGKSGGYGFHVGERYRDGAVHTTLCSPWHDGEESSEKKEWVCWVLECIGSVTAGRRSPP